MSRGPCTFRQSDVTRAVRAVAKAGVEVGRYEIAKDGRIIIVPRSAMQEVPQGDLDRELLEFEARHGEG
jgi:hypothetical protein